MLLQLEVVKKKIEKKRKKKSTKTTGVKVRHKQVDRRKYRKLSPYIFFLFEIAILAEFNYIVITLLGLNTIIASLLIGVNIYVVLHCFHKLMDVLERCRFIKSYNKYKT